MKTNDHSTRLGTEGMGSLLFRLSLPAIAGFLINSLYNLVDTIFVGQGVGSQAIGGLAIAFPIQMLAVGLAQLAGVGAASILSRSLGAGDRKRASQAGGNGIFASIVLSLLLMGIGLAFLRPILTLFGASEGLMPYAEEYTRIILYGVFFNIMSMSIANLIQAQGAAKAAMISTLIGCLLNIGLDPLFIFVFDLGVAGAAWATILSQFVSFVYVCAYLQSRHCSLKFELKDLRPRLPLIRDIFGVGSSAFLRSITSTIFSIVVNNSLGFYGGDLAITVFGIVNRVIALLFLPALGVVQGMQPIVGYNYGAKNIDRVKRALFLSIRAATLLSAAGWGIALLMPGGIVRAFTSDSTVVETGARVLRIIFALAPVIGMQMVASGFYQSLGRAAPAIVFSLLRQFIILTPLILILPRLFGLGLEGVWFAFPIADAVAASIVAVFLVRDVRRLAHPELTHPEA